MFHSVETAPPDAILGLNEAFREDTNPEKMNLGVGVFQDDSGVTPTLQCVQEAERRLAEQNISKSYLPIDGYPQYHAEVGKLMLGEKHEVVSSGRIATIQTPGGTGALRVAADFLSSSFPNSKVWFSDPTWANHHAIFKAAGLVTSKYTYLDPSTNGLNFDAMLADIDKMDAGDVMVLHGCCHNPTGVDPSIDQWKQIAEKVSAIGVLPLIDFAYQGFGDGLEEDSAGLLEVVAKNSDVLVCSSFSKNFGLYRERVGALNVIGPNSGVAKAVLSQVKKCVRCNYSNPPFHGAAIVATVLHDAQLRGQWQQELTAMRDRINDMRAKLVEGLQALKLDRDFSFFATQRGMFSFSGLTPEHVAKLRNEHSVYIVGSGRINVAGITSKNLPRLCEAIATVLKA